MEPSKKPNLFRLATLKESELSSAVSSGKTLKKHLGSSMKLVNIFFHNLGKSLQKKGISKTEVAGVFNNKELWNLEEFICKIREFDTKITQKDINIVFNVLSVDELINSQIITKELKKSMQQSDSSSESSDISSPSDGEYVQEEFDIETVNSLYEIISFKLKYGKITSESLSEIITESLPAYSDGEKLNKFFLKKEFRIEEGVGRNMLISSILSGKIKIPKGEILNILQEKCFKNYLSEITSPVTDDLKARFINLCCKEDKRRTGNLTWRILEKVFQEVGISIDLNLKYYCFALDGSLEMIPYQLI
ncbi:hypothetical protein SteCoe_12055 [Stentor coeruleus]|uniref:Uncharacterized protein n=1 Tax=Stentor coeruleus TaxID=5963 RepID=A0A1R2CBM1_9CILI|nr:hypothetical protein SteCoe_12055 [Stentor coeruleus]